MSTPRRDAANRENAQKSTGPRTEEGKLVSRANSFQHGLAGCGPVCEAAFGEIVVQHQNMFAPMYPVRTEAEAYLLEQLCVATVQLRLAQNREAALIDHERSQAQENWDEFRNELVSLLAKRIHKEPGLTVARLRTSRHGCLWLRNAWSKLADELALGSWTEVHDARARDLIGVDAIFSGHSPWRKDPAAFIQARIDEYEAMAEKYTNIDEFEREYAMRGISVLSTEEMKLLHRYQTTLMRRHQFTHALLNRFLAEPPLASPQPTRAPIRPTPVYPELVEREKKPVEAPPPAPPEAAPTTRPTPAPAPSPRIERTTPPPRPAAGPKSPDQITIGRAQPDASRGLDDAARRLRAMLEAGVVDPTIPARPSEENDLRSRDRRAAFRAVNPKQPPPDPRPKA